MCKLTLCVRVTYQADLPVPYSLYLINKLQSLLGVFFWHKVSVTINILAKTSHLSLGETKLSFVIK